MYRITIPDINGSYAPSGTTTGWMYLPKSANNRVQVDACLREGAIAQIISFVIYPENSSLIFQRGHVQGSDFKPQYSLCCAYGIDGTMQGRIAEWCGANNSTTVHTLPDWVILEANGITRISDDFAVSMPGYLNYDQIIPVVAKNENPFKYINLGQILRKPVVCEY